MNISQIIPDPDALLAMHPSQLAGVLLVRMNEPGQRGSWHSTTISNPEYVKVYPEGKRSECLLALMEAWSFLTNEGFLVRQPMDSGEWLVLSRLGKSMKSSDDFTSFLHSRIYPKESIHPKITKDVYPLFMSGDYETCIFKAFKAVEVAVREAAGSDFSELIGVNLMRNAFHPDKGPLTNPQEPISEREALMHLFAGAIGRFKNPTSHRNVAITSPQETVEAIQFASHLLRVVDDRATSS